MEKNKGLLIIAIYLFLAVYLLPMFPHGGSANELTRWATAASLVERSSFEIGWTSELIGPNVDTAKIENGTYSNKPPGTALLAAPIYALTRVAVGPPNESNIRVSWFAMRFFLATLPLLLLAYWLYSRDTDELSLAVLLFASPLFVYSLLFFSHVLVAVLLYFAFRVIYDSPRIFLRNCFFAGLICGFAVICEFPALIPVAVLGGGLLFTDRRDRFRNVMFFVAGGLPFGIFLLAYNQAVFGSAFAMSYAHESFPEWAEVASQGVFGISYPSLSNLYLLLISPARGLLFFAPILVLSVIAFVLSRESKTLRHRVKVAAIVLTVIVMSGHGAAHGGWAFGPRYIVMILPLLLDSFFDGEIYETSNVWQGFLFVISFVLCTLPILTFPFAPPEFKYPHNSFWGSFIWGEQWFTPNLANVFGAPSGIIATVPAIVALASVVYIVWRYTRRPLMFFIGAIAGSLVVTGYLMLPNLDSAENQFRRATIAERYFKPGDRLESLRASVPPEMVRSFEWRIADARAFGPNDFPYLSSRERSKSPTAVVREAAVLQQSGRVAEAEALLLGSRDQFPFARCEFTTNLGVIYFATDRKDAARAEFESIQGLIDANSRPDCQRAQFFLASIYQEIGEKDKAGMLFARFITNTARSTDPKIKAMRQQLGVK